MGRAFAGRLLLDPGAESWLGRGDFFWAAQFRPVEADSRRAFRRCTVLCELRSGDVLDRLLCGEILRGGVSLWHRYHYTGAPRRPIVEDCVQEASVAEAVSSRRPSHRSLVRHA